MDKAGNVEFTVGLGHIDDGQSDALCLVKIGCEMVEISAKVDIRVWYRAEWVGKGFNWGRELSRIVLSASGNLVVVLAGRGQPG